MDPLKVLWVLTNSTYLVSKYAKGRSRSPMFAQSRYEVEVEEDVQPHHTVLRVTVQDHHKFPDIKYEIAGGNVEGAFAVNSKTGDIYVDSPLDFETKQEYELVYCALVRRNQSVAQVVISVKDVNDNPPVFQKTVYTAEITEEDDRNLPKRILQVHATDADFHQPLNIVYFLAGQGVDSADPATGNFAIDKTSGEIFVLKPLDRDGPLGQPQWRFTVFAQDEGGTGLVGFTEVLLTLKDINDNAPVFTRTTYIGNLTENSPTGALVIRISAEDNDDPLENGNAKIKYSIEKNAIEEGSGLPIFGIDSASGEIRTLICCLDRERTSDYAIQVIATDAAGLKGTGTVTIHVLDMNDSVPMFTKDEWFTDVKETTGDVIPSAPVLTVAVRDADESNRFVYSVVEKSGYGADRFRMVDNEDGTGSLVVSKPLDFEDPLQSHGFRFQIRVIDQDINQPSAQSHVAYSWVTVRLTDVNDNTPQFDSAHLSVTVGEDVPVGRLVTSLRATDGDRTGQGAVRYSVDRASDRRRQFYVSQDGRLTVHRPLDRETASSHQILVLAVDDGFPPRTGTATVTVSVEDVNDNAPVLLENYRPVVLENQAPGEVVTLHALDRDDPAKGNGAPFTFFLDPAADNTTRLAFRVEQEDNGVEDVARVFSMVTFDREQQKQYLVPIVIRDAGYPVCSGTSTLTVVVGDVNDNPMLPGYMDVLAYVYRAQNVDTPLGRVYVEDPDDWDLADKQFRWEGREHPRFRLDESTGGLGMRAGTPRGLYELRFRVRDRRHGQEAVAARVRVRVRDLSHSAVINSGSLRLSGVSAVDLVMRTGGKSKLSSLQTKLARVLEVEEDRVEIFSVQQVVSHPPLTDIRFSVSNFRREVLDGLLMLHAETLEEAGVVVQQVGVDECLEERRHCEASCTTRLEAGAAEVVNANSTVLVGLRVAVVAECLCGALDYSRPESCRARPCYNGGRCVEGRYGISCSCPDGFTGPRCQKTSRSFGGAGWAWYPPLAMCESSHLSLEFLARRADGQLLYNGPVVPPKPGGVTNSDFISVELVDGYPRLLLDYGSGTLELRVITETRLNDSAWHTLDILWNTDVVELVVDSCLGVQGLSAPSACQAKGSVPPFSEQLNVNTPLQLGGRHVRDFPPSVYRWTHVPYGKPFDGCIKNLFYNSKLYDLAGSGLYVDSEPGCPGACPGSPCELQGECVGSAREPRCRCVPGRQGPHCTEPTGPVTLGPHSYVKYALNFDPGPHFTELQLRFRTREESGELIRLGDTRSRQFAILEIVESRVRFRYRLSDSYKTHLQISTVQINDGQWHHVKVWRSGSAVSVELDGGEGRRGNRTLDYSSRHFLTVDTEEGLYLGGKPEYTEIGTIAIEHDFQEGCIDDVRLNGRSLPLPPTSNSSAWAQVLTAQHVEVGCPVEKLCSGGLCLGVAECSDPWNTHRCFCGEGRVLTADGKLCVKSDDCFVKPCVHGGVCEEVEGRQQYRCVCPDGYWGDRCELVHSKHTMRLGVGALATVLGCILLILLVVVLMLVIYNRRRDSVDKKDLECDVRENIIKYKDEGGGVEDMTAVTLNVSALEHPVMGLDTETSFIDLTKRNITEERTGIFSMVPDEEDDVRIYTFEGGGSDMGSLSSLSIYE